MVRPTYLMVGLLLAHILRGRDSEEKIMQSTGRDFMLSHTAYDESSDVLYITLGEPQKAVADECGDGVFIRRNQEGKIVGITIMNFKDRK